MSPLRKKKQEKSPEPEAQPEVKEKSEAELFAEWRDARKREKRGFVPTQEGAKGTE